MNESKVDVTVRQERVKLIEKFKAKQFDKLSSDDKAAIAYIIGLSHDFNECFKQLFDDSDYLGFNTMGRDAGLTGDTVASYYYGKSKPKSKKIVLALISTMEIHPKVGHFLLKTMSWNLESSDNEDDMLYCRLMGASTKHFILYEGKEYNILSVENVKGRNMYIEVLAKKVEASK